MRLLRHVIVAIAIVSIAIPSLLRAHDSHTSLRFGYMPFSISYTDHENKAQGASIELIELLSKSIGFEVDFIEAPNRRLRTKIINGEVDFTISTPRYSDYNSGNVLISSFPFQNIHMMAFTTSNEIEIRHQEDLFGKRVIVRRGYDYLGWRDFMDRHPDKIEIAGIANSTDQAIKMLDAGRGNVLLEYKGNIKAALGEIKIKSLYYVGLNFMPLHLIVSRATPRAEQIMTLYSKAYQDHIRQKLITSNGRLVRSQASAKP